MHNDNPARFWSVSQAGDLLPLQRVVGADGAHEAAGIHVRDGQTVVRDAFRFSEKQYLPLKAKAPFVQPVVRIRLGGVDVDESFHAHSDIHAIVNFCKQKSIDISYAPYRADGFSDAKPMIVVDGKLIGDLVAFKRHVKKHKQDFYHHHQSRSALALDCDESASTTKITSGKIASLNNDYLASSAFLAQLYSGVQVLPCLGSPHYGETFVTFSLPSGADAPSAGCQDDRPFKDMAFRFVGDPAAHDQIEWVHAVGCMFGSALQGRVVRPDGNTQSLSLVDHTIEDAIYGYDAQCTQVSAQLSCSSGPYIDKISVEAFPHAYEAMMLGVFPKLLAFVKSLEKPGVRQVGVHYHLPGPDYILFGFRMYVLGMMTRSAFAEYVGEVQKRYMAHKTLLESMSHDAEVKFYCHSPFAVLMPAADPEGWTAECILRHLGVGDRNVIDPLVLGSMDPGLRQSKRQALARSLLQRILTDDKPNVGDANVADAWRECLRLRVNSGCDQADRLGFDAPASQIVDRVIASNDPELNWSKSFTKFFHFGNKTLVAALVRMQGDTKDVRDNRVLSLLPQDETPIAQGYRGTFEHEFGRIVQVSWMPPLIGSAQAHNLFKQRMPWLSRPEKLLDQDKNELVSRVTQDIVAKLRDSWDPDGVNKFAREILATFKKGASPVEVRKISKLARALEDMVASESREELAGVLQVMCGCVAGGAGNVLIATIRELMHVKGPLGSTLQTETHSFPPGRWQPNMFGASTTTAGLLIRQSSELTSSASGSESDIESDAYDGSPDGQRLRKKITPRRMRRHNARSTTTRRLAKDHPSVLTDPTHIQNLRPFSFYDVSGTEADVSRPGSGLRVESPASGFEAVMG